MFGTRVHDALAKQDGKSLTPEQEDIYESCNAIANKILPSFFGEEIKGMLAIPTREKRYWIRWADGLAHSGQIDAVYRKGTKALIVEYKTLTADIPASSRNLQLRDQAALFEFNCPLLTDVAVAVIQPLVTHTPEICVYSKADISRAREEMYYRVNASNKKDAPRTAGELQCKYCRAKMSCPTYNKWAGATVMAKEDLLDLPVKDWTPAMRAQFLDRLLVAEKWLEATKAEMKRQLKLDPASIPGYCLTEGNTRSTITNAQAVFDSFQKAGGKLNDFMGCISVTKTKLKAAVKTATDLKGKKLDDKLDEIIGPNVETSQNEPSISKV